MQMKLKGRLPFQKWVLGTATCLVHDLVMDPFTNREAVPYKMVLHGADAVILVEWSWHLGDTLPDPASGPGGSSASGPLSRPVTLSDSGMNLASLPAQLFGNFF